VIERVMVSRRLYDCIASFFLNNDNKTKTNLDGKNATGIVLAISTVMLSSRIVLCTGSSVDVVVN
jgi:hypothetical protein